MLKSQSKIPEIEDALLILFFVGALCMPVIGMTLRWHVMSEQEEKRHLAKLPQLPESAHAIKTLPEEFTAYFNDNFGFRSTLIHLQAAAKLNLLRESSSPLVIVGKDGWLFFSIEYAANGKHLVPPLTDAELEHWKLLLEGRRDWLAQQGIPYLVTVFPRKEVIYPEYLPDSFRPAGESRLEQLTAYLKKHSDLEILDLKPALFAAKPRHRIYYQTDSHWNYYGGLAGYQAIVAQLSKSFPQMKPITESDCSVVDEKRTGDLTMLMGLTGWTSEKTSILQIREPAFVANPDARIKILYKPLGAVVTEGKESNQPRLVMFDDSGGARLVPFLPQHFSHAAIVWQFRLDSALVKSEHPDIVIQEMGEVIFANGYSVDLHEIDELKSGDKDKTTFEISPIPR